MWYVQVEGNGDHRKKNVGFLDLETHEAMRKTLKN